MLETVELEGLWWTPEEKERAATGTLYFTPEEGVRLTVLSQEPELPRSGRLPDDTVILGITLDGKRVSLHGCLVEERRSAPFVLQQTRYYCHIAFVGVHFEELSDALFQGISVRFSRLPEWTSFSGMTRAFRSAGAGIDYELEYSRPTPVVIHWGEGRIEIGCALSFSENLTETVVKDVHYSAYRTEQFMDFATLCSRFVNPFQDFLSLATGRPNSMTSLMAFFPEPDEDDKWIPPATVLFSQRCLEDLRGRPKTLLRNRMLFTLNDVKGHLDRFLPNWLDSYEDIGVSCALHFSSQYRPSAYAEHSFLGEVFALEAFHRAKFCNDIVPPKDHASRMARILDGASSLDRRWLKRELSWSNQRTLRMRLQDLADPAEQMMVPVTGKLKDWVDRVVKTRAYLVHRPQKPTRQTVLGSDLVQLTNQLRLLMETHLLSVCGFGWAEVADLFEQNRRYQWMVQHARH